MSDTTVTVGDEGSDAAESQNVESVAEAAKASGEAEAAAEQAKDAASKVEFERSQAEFAAQQASQAAQATADSALATSMNVQEVHGLISGLSAEIAALRDSLKPAEPPVDNDGDGIPDPVTASDVAPHDQEPQKKGHWLTRSWGSKSK